MSIAVILLINFFLFPLSARGENNLFDFQDVEKYLYDISKISIPEKTGKKNALILEQNIDDAVGDVLYGAISRSSSLSDVKDVIETQVDNIKLTKAVSNFIEFTFEGSSEDLEEISVGEKTYLSEEEGCFSCMICEKKICYGGDSATSKLEAIASIDKHETECMIKTKNDFKQKAEIDNVDTNSPRYWVKEWYDTVEDTYQDFQNKKAFQQEWNSAKKELEPQHEKESHTHKSEEKLTGFTTTHSPAWAVVRCYEYRSIRIFTFMRGVGRPRLGWYIITAEVFRKQDLPQLPGCTYSIIQSFKKKEDAINFAKSFKIQTTFSKPENICTCHFPYK